MFIVQDTSYPDQTSVLVHKLEDLDDAITS